MVEDLPTRQQMQKLELRNPHHLLGLYEGIALTSRPLGYAGALPDRITIFRVPIEEMCSSEDEIRVQVRKTVMHELGHYFGMDEGQLESLDE
jgi:predicted Zn-dependent protease with MMP-like domain